MTPSPSLGQRLGATDSPETAAARSALTAAQRLEWLSESLDLALATGALALDRERRQREALQWAAASSGRPASS